MNLKDSEEALRESEERYRSLLELDSWLGEAVVMLQDTEKGKAMHTFVSNEWPRITGYSEEELLGMSWFDIVNPQYRETVMGRYQKRMLGETLPGLFEISIIRKDGSEVPVEVTSGHTTYKMNRANVVYIRDVTERKQAEEEIAKFKAITEHASYGVIMNTLEGTTLYVNESFARMHGYTREELIGIHFTDFYDKQDKKLIQTKRDDSIKKVYSYNIEINRIKKDGISFPTITSGTVVRDAEGNPIFTAGTVLDITERKQVEEALKEGEQRYIHAEKLGQFGHWRRNFRDEEAIWSAGAYRIFGVEPDRFKPIQENILNLVHPDDKEALRRAREDASLRGEKFDIEYRITRPNGEERVLHSVADVDTDINGKPRGLFGTVIDITERKQAEERINHLNLTLRSIRNISQLITREKDRDRLLQGVCNHLVESQCCHDVWVALLDESRKLVAYAEGGLGKDFSPLREQLKAGKLPACGQKAIRRSQVVITEDPHSMCTDCPLSLKFSGRGGLTIRLEYAGKVYGILCASVPKGMTLERDEVELFKEVATDIAFALRNIELQAEYELQEEERLKIAKLESVGVLAGGIAHDFNNILTGIMGNISLARRGLESGEIAKASNRLVEAEKASLRAKDLTQQLLTFSSGGAPIKITTSIIGILEDSISLALRGSDVRCELSLPDDIWPVEADEGQISQAISNLVLNADQAMPEGGTLNIDVRNTIIGKRTTLPLARGNYVQITIEDHGVGIPKEHLLRVFDPYFTTKQKGSGLGLSTVHSIIKKHGGHVTIESEPGVGTTLQVYLPASMEPIPAVEEVAAEARVVGAGRVLVMDDEEMVRDLLHSELTGIGYEVELASGGAEAIKKYANAKETGQPFAAVILDLTVPGGMGGKETIKKLLEIDPDVKAIVSSGYSTDPIMIDFVKYGFKGVVVKPYRTSELEHVLHKVIAEVGA